MGTVMATGFGSPAGRRRRCGVALAIGIGLLAGQGPVGAAGMSEGLARGIDKEAKQEAKVRFASGQSHYNLNEFTEALLDFKEAYRVLPDPVLLFNLGQCERQLGHLEEAIRFYRSYLREQPKAPNRQDVVRKIDEIEATLKTRPLEADKGAPPPSDSEDVSPTVAPPSAPTVERQDIPPSPSPANGSVSLPLNPPVVAPIIADNGPGRIDLTDAPSTSPSSSASSSPYSPTTSAKPPFYSHWWFWTAAGVVAAGAGVGIYAATANHAPAAPSSVLGSQKVF